MFGFFKSKKTPERQLDHAKDLKVGDMLTIIDSFAYPSWLKGKTLKVIGVQTYQYERSAEYEFVLESDSGKVTFLQIEQSDGEEYANFSIKIQREDVDAIFSLDEFARIFDEESLTHINTQATPEPLERFLGKSYQQSEAPYVCYFYDSDYRDRTLPRYQDESGEACEVIELISSDEKYAINIEVWDGGETDVSLTMCRPLSDIIDLFPGASS